MERKKYCLMAKKRIWQAWMHVGFETACQLVVACYDFADGASSVHLNVLIVNPFHKPDIIQWNNITLAVS